MVAPDASAGADIVRIACCQLRPVIGDLDGNRQMARQAIRNAVAAGARLIVLPELCTTGYMFSSADEAKTLAQPAEGGALDDWRAEAAAGGAVVVGGFAESDGTALYNSAAVVDGSGILAVYRKIHLWNSELSFFEAGSELPPVVSTPIGNIGLSVCYDLFFPELTRALTLAGTDILAVPTNSPAGTEAEPAANIGVSMARAAAHVNRVYVAVCDRWGVERGARWAGRSVIVDPDGELVASPPGDRASLLLADCDLRRARDKNWPGTANNAIRDRRPDLYRRATDVSTEIVQDPGNNTDSRIQRVRERQRKRPPPAAASISPFSAPSTASI